MRSAALAGDAILGPFRLERDDLITGGGDLYAGRLLDWRDEW